MYHDTDRRFRRAICWHLALENFNCYTTPSSKHSCDLLFCLRLLQSSATQSSLQSFMEVVFRLNEKDSFLLPSLLQSIASTLLTSTSFLFTENTAYQLPSTYFTPTRERLFMLSSSTLSYPLYWCRRVSPCVFRLLVGRERWRWYDDAVLSCSPQLFSGNGVSYSRTGLCGVQAQESRWTRPALVHWPNIFGIAHTSQEANQISFQALT